VAILSHTRYEWAVADMAILTAGGLVVPLYPNLAPNEAADLIRRSGSRLLFASDREQVEKILQFFDKANCLERVVVFDAEALEGVRRPDFVAQEAWLAEAGATESGIDETSLAQRVAATRGDDAATIIYTSGTTGEPKGVLLSHRNILSNCEAAGSLFDLGPGDSCLSHLPLAHIFERMAGYYFMLSIGATIAYAESIKTVVEDLALVRPTVCVSVPRIFEKIYAGLQAKAADASLPVRALTFWALDVANRVGRLKEGGNEVPLLLGLRYAVADRLVYARVRRLFGGRVRLFVSGGAPLDADLAVFFNTIGIPVLEGYGLTETSPVVTCNTFEHRKAGTVGRPIPGVEVRIGEDGEILVRGPNVFQGYYKDEEATREAISEGGWFHTGDIGEFDSEGMLVITDRKKDLIVTAGGKNVAPQKVEGILKRDKYIAEAMLYGDRRPFITALVVPDFGWIGRYAQWKEISYKDRCELVKNPRIVDFIARRIDKMQEEAHLAPYETVKKFVLLDHEFSPREGEVTPTMKIRRKQITEHYKRELDALYEKDK
jgi:long-chain acyl-CoA synthetase